LTYGVLYGISCLITAHGGSFFYLIFGRVFGGIATAILFSVFESWLVSAGQKASLTSRGLDLIFTQQTMTNSLIAVFSGFLAQFIADVFGVEYVFDFAALILFTVSILAAIILEENYGKILDSNFWPYLYKVYT
jgi:MFS family permease